MQNIKKNDQDLINENDKKELEQAGVDLSMSSSSDIQQDIALDKQEEFVDIDSTPTVTNDPDVATTGIKFFDEINKENKEDLSLLAEKKEKEMAAADLEEEFKSELSATNISAEPEKAIFEKGLSMKKLLSKIREKLGLKKNKVKTELDSLKKMKDGISKDILEIKELEESEKKIETEIKKIDTIKEEMENIEKEVSEELQK